MKNLKTNIVVSCIMVLFALPFAFSQTYSEKESSSKEVLTDERLTPAVLATLGISTTPNPRSALIQNNAIFLKQIGDYNRVQIRTITEASEINLEQNGNYNNTTLDYTTKTAIANLLQKGNSNRILDFVNNPEADVSLDLIQEGSNLNFERNGVNEITKSLQFRQTEASPSIIIRSFN